MHRFVRTLSTILTIVAALTLATAVLYPGTVRAAATTTAGSITEYPVPTASSEPADIATGSDGALWFTEHTANQIGRISTAGSFSEYAIPTPISYNYPMSITAGPDGALWFTEDIGGSSSIDRITTSGTFTEYPVPGLSQLLDITAGPDGALWFVECDTALPYSSWIGRITTSGNLTQYNLPQASNTFTCAMDITAGPDGALWFTAFNNDGSNAWIGRITTSGTITEFAVVPTNSDPWGITSGPDGALWFTQYNSNQIGRITVAGIITEYSVPFPSGSPGGYSMQLQEITSGPDGALWFTEGNGAQIGRITTSGTFTSYTVPTAAPNLDGITSGPDGALWFTEANSNQIGRITASSPPPPSYQLSLTPASQTGLTIGDQGLVTATLLDAATSAPVPNVQLSFRVESGPNGGLSGTCFPNNCTTDENGQVDWGYFGTSNGVDTVQVWWDSNGNGSPDAGEPQSTAIVTWIVPSATTMQSVNYAGYVLRNTPIKPVSAVITVPTIPATCATSSYSSFWVGFNGFKGTKYPNYLPQVGFSADCLAADAIRPSCGVTMGDAYYLWWEIDPNKGNNPICSQPLHPGDKVYVKVEPGTSQVTLTARVTHPDGSTNPVWTMQQPVKHTVYATMDCLAEDTLTGHNMPTPLADFTPVEFDSCSAIPDYQAGTTLEQFNIFVINKSHTWGSEKAQTGPLMVNNRHLVAFTVTRLGD